MQILIIFLVVLCSGAIGGFLYFLQSTKNLKEELQKEKTIELSEDEAINKASSKAKNIVLNAKNEALEIKSKADNKIKERFSELEEEEKRLENKEQRLNKKTRNLDKEEAKLEKMQERLRQAKNDVKGVRSALDKKLEKVAQMSRKQAQKALLEEVEEDLKNDIAKKIKQAEAEAERKAEEKAKWILVDAMQKAATDYVSETTTTTINIDNEDTKGKIIGKDGRNIRAFEKLTGVDIIVDEAPEQVTLSCFDPVRREVAALALKQLLKDGRVHPGTIEKTVKSVKRDIGRQIKKNGEKLSYEGDLHDAPVEIIRLLGRFKYRYSYGQNLVKHTIEMIKLGTSLASELRADVALVKKACLLHDIGKVLVHEIEGKPHHHISGDVIRKYFRDEKLANAVEAHHGDIKPKSVEAEIVRITDAISGARPGARRDNYEDYIKRIRALEDIAQKHKEVKEAYAIHAGREVRVILKPEESTDKDATLIGKKVAKEIEETQQYPGTVKVTVIREMRVEKKAK